jgi:hypothetical protein
MLQRTQILVREGRYQRLRGQRMLFRPEVPVVADEIIKHAASQALCPNTAASPANNRVWTHEGARSDADS